MHDSTGPRGAHVAWALAAMFALTALVSRLPNPVVGPDGLFVTNGAHDLVHLATAVAFAALALVGDRPAIAFMKTFGVVYFMVGVLGFMTLGAAPEGHLLGLVHINRMDNVLHVGLATLIFGAGLLSTAPPPRVEAA